MIKGNSFGGGPVRPGPAGRECLNLRIEEEKKMTGKRTDYITWDEYFMGIAMLSACRSKDPNTQVGACIVNDRNRIMSVGYNGFPSGCDDDEFPWEREGNAFDTKYHRRRINIQGIIRCKNIRKFLNFAANCSK